MAEFDLLHLGALALLMLAGAALYSTVGHAGASAYLALMALFAVQPVVMRPTALVLNILVAGVATIRYLRAGLFDARMFWSVAVAAIPMAFVGGALQLPDEIYRKLVGLVLLYAAIRFLWPSPAGSEDRPTRHPPLPLALACGAVIGILSGLTGTGGGIFLSPLMILAGWLTPRRASGVAALFILCNSLAGLAGNYASVRALPAELPILAGAVLIGGLIGTSLGVRRLGAPGLLKALAVVLLIASAKLLFG
jgi:hypothetical protein